MYDLYEYWKWLIWSRFEVDEQVDKLDVIPRIDLCDDDEVDDEMFSLDYIFELQLHMMLLFDVDEKQTVENAVSHVRVFSHIVDEMIDETHIFDRLSWNDENDEACVLM